MVFVRFLCETQPNRCRAFCRYLLRAGHQTLPAARFRRLRGGIFGWKHRGGPMTAMLRYSGEDHGAEGATPSGFDVSALKSEAEAEVAD